MQHLIFSKLKSTNTLNGVFPGDKRIPFSQEFLSEETSKVPENIYEALKAEEGGIFNTLLESGDFVESAKSMNKNVASLQGEIKKLQAALKAAEEEAEALANPTLSVEEAELAFMQAEEDLANVTDASKKKEAKKAVADAKKAFEAAKKKAKA